MGALSLGVAACGDDDEGDTGGGGELRRPEDLGVRYAEPVRECGDTGHYGGQQNRRRGARNLVAIRHRQVSHVFVRIRLRPASLLPRTARRE